VPPGLGEPVFDKLEAELAKAMLSLPATKGFEIGSGFAAQRCAARSTTMRSSWKVTRAHDDEPLGRVQGGISNGEPIFFRVGFKPTATIFRPQQTVTVTGENTELQAKGRHDPACFRAPCPWWRRWQRWCCAITRCGSGRSRPWCKASRSMKFHSVLLTATFVVFAHAAQAALSDAELERIAGGLAE
jgi:hypothetical protein